MSVLRSIIEIAHARAEKVNIIHCYDGLNKHKPNTIYKFPELADVICGDTAHHACDGLFFTRNGALFPLRDMPRRVLERMYAGELSDECYICYEPCPIVRVFCFHCGASVCSRCVYLGSLTTCGMCRSAFTDSNVEKLHNQVFSKKYIDGVEPVILADTDRYEFIANHIDHPFIYFNQIAAELQDIFITQYSNYSYEEMISKAGMYAVKINRGTKKEAVDEIHRLITLIDWGDETPDEYFKRNHERYLKNYRSFIEGYRVWLARTPSKAPNPLYLEEL